MSKVFIEESTLTAIGDAIRSKEGSTALIAPLDMADKITNLPSGGGSSSDSEHLAKLRDVIDYYGSNEVHLTARDLEGIQGISPYAFYMCSRLKSIEFPNTVTRIGSYAFPGTYLTHVDLPESVVAIYTQAFYSCQTLKTAKIWNKTSKVSIEGSAWPKTIETIYVPSALYDEYMADSSWSSYPIKPWGEWVFEPKISGALLFNSTKEFTIELSAFDSTPQFSIVSSNPAVATVSDVAINADNTAITYKVNSLAVEGTSTITATITSPTRTYEYSGDIIVWETMPESTYEVVAVDGASYGFALNDAGYWESQSKGQKVSAALCQINISNVAGRKLYLDCINYAEANYDYGILGAVNQTLGKTDSEDRGVKQSFKGLSKADIQTVVYGDATGNCFIQVKFRKDSSGDQNNDSLQFKVRFEE